MGELDLSTRWFRGNKTLGSQFAVQR